MGLRCEDKQKGFLRDLNQPQKLILGAIEIALKSHLSRLVINCLKKVTFGGDLKPPRKLTYVGNLKSPS